MEKSGPTYRDAVSLAPHTSRDAREGRAYIAVIGIDEYRTWPRLNNAVSDAKGAQKLFAGVGFDLVAQPLFNENATGNALRQLVIDDLRGLGEDDSLVVFFAGHGHTIPRTYGETTVKDGYLIPVDADPEGGHAATWISLQSWLTEIARIPAKHILVVLDACHSGVALDPVLQWRSRGMENARREPFEQLRARRSRRVITSAHDNELAMDSGPVPGHSLFTGCLIEAMSGGLVANTDHEVVTGSEIGLYVQRRVSTYPRSAQTPDFGALELDDRGELLVRIRRDGADEVRSGGMLGDGDLQPIELAPTLPRVDFTVRTDAATYRVTETLARGDIATIYGGRVAASGADIALKIADHASNNDLLQYEARVLGLVLATRHETAIHFAPPRDQFRTGDGRLGSVFDRLDGLDLTAIRDVFRRRGEPGLPARHVVWILQRALAALGWAHNQGILHGNLDPSHVIVRGRDHMVWLVDWCWAVVNPAHPSQGFKALNQTYSPPEVAARGRPMPASDLYALGKCAIHVLGGDAAAKTVPDGVDPRLAHFLHYLCVESQGGRGQDAWELHTRLDKLREQIWGKHEFVPLDLSHSDNGRS